MNRNLVTACWRLLGVALILLATFFPDVATFQLGGWLQAVFTWAGAAGWYFVIFPPSARVEPLRLLLLLLKRGPGLVARVWRLRRAFSRRDPPDAGGGYATE